MKKFRNGKLVLVGLLSLVIGIAGTVGVFAAIPDTNTKVITACRNNLSGALRAIDAQAGATCNFLESSLSWSTGTSSGSSPKTAIFHLKADSSDPDFNYSYDPNLSRGIVGVKKLIANDATNNPTNSRGYCVDLGFSVLYSNSADATATYEAAVPGNQALIDEACGLGFDAFLQATSGEKAIFFTE